MYASVVFSITMKDIRIVDKCQSDLIVHMLVRRSSHLFNLSRFDGASVDVGRLSSLQARGSQQPTDGFGGGYSSFERKDDSNGVIACWKFTEVLFELINRLS